MSQKLLDNYLSVYEFPFFNEETQHQALCQHVLSHAPSREKVRNSMRVLVPGPITGKARIVAIQNSLKYRIPVYFGADQTDMFSPERLEAVAGYSLEEAHSKLDTNVRYAICGRILASSADQPFAWAYASHVWGVNFESRQTDDWKRFTKHGRIDREPYSACVRDLVRLILESGLHACKDSGVGICEVVVPMVGLGAFMKEIGTTDQAWALDLLASTMSEMSAKKEYACLRVGLYDYDGRVTVAQAKKWKHACFQIHRGKDNGDMFKAAAKMIANSCVCVINAFDPVSWVGNGGSEDMTCDGMLVGGAGAGKVFSNSSYVHNSFLMPITLDPKCWIDVSSVDEQPGHKQDVVIQVDKSTDHFLVPGKVTVLSASERVSDVVGCVCVGSKPHVWTYDWDTGSIIDEATGYAWDMYEEDAGESESNRPVYLWHTANGGTAQTFHLGAKNGQVMFGGAHLKVPSRGAKKTARMIFGGDGDANLSSVTAVAAEVFFSTQVATTSSDELVDTKVWGTVTTSGDWLEIRLDEDKVTRQDLLAIARDYAKHTSPKWKHIAAPPAWSQGSGPHVTLASTGAMRRLIGKRILVTLGEPYGFSSATAHWIVLDAKIAACYDCGEHACHVSIGHQPL